MIDAEYLHCVLTSGPRPVYKKEANTEYFIMKLLFIPVNLLYISWVITLPQPWRVCRPSKQNVDFWLTLETSAGLRRSHASPSTGSHVRKRHLAFLVTRQQKRFLQNEQKPGVQSLKSCPNLAGLKDLNLYVRRGQALLSAGRHLPGHSWTADGSINLPAGRWKSDKTGMDCWTLLDMLRGWETRNHAHQLPIWTSWH